MDLGKLGTGEQKYLPWMQATYLMAANKKALEFLPQGADINKITYDQLIEWSKKMAEATGSPKFGFPAGPKGLKHRFFQGFLYPSYTELDGDEIPLGRGRRPAGTSSRSSGATPIPIRPTTPSCRSRC